MVTLLGRRLSGGVGLLPGGRLNFNHRSIVVTRGSSYGGIIAHRIYE
jgi:hypothetical protein